jgi:hypothetical protein
MVLLDGRPLPAIDVEVPHLEGAHTFIEASGSHIWSPRSHCVWDYQLTPPEDTSNVSTSLQNLSGTPLV